MKKVITMALAVAMILTMTTPAMAGSKSNKQIVKSYVAKHYKGYKIKYVASEKLSFEALTNRAGKKTVIVEVVKSKSKGKHGTTAEGYYIKYNKKVKKGKTVTSYVIFNPRSNAEDDVVAVVDNRRIR